MRNAAVPQLSVFLQDGGPHAFSPSILPHSAHTSDPWPQRFWAAGGAWLGRRVRVLRTDHPAPVVPCSALLTHTGPQRFCLSTLQCGKTNAGGGDQGSDPLLQQLNRKPNGFQPLFPPGCVPLLPTYLGGSRGHPRSSRGRGHPPRSSRGRGHPPSSRGRGQPSLAEAVGTLPGLAEAVGTLPGLAEAVGSPQCSRGRGQPSVAEAVGTPSRRGHGHPPSLDEAVGTPPV